MYENSLVFRISGLLYFYIISISILFFIHGSPSGKRPDLQGAMLKKKKSDLAIYSERNAILTTNGIKK